MINYISVPSSPSSPEPEVNHSQYNLPPPPKPYNVRRDGPAPRINRSPRSASGRLSSTAGHTPKGKGKEKGKARLIDEEPVVLSD